MCTPEEIENLFPCDCGGSITERDKGLWMCDSCNLVAKEVANNVASNKIGYETIFNQLNQLTFLIGRKPCQQ